MAKNARRKPRARKAVSKRSVKPSRKFVKMVKKVIHSQSEDKMAYASSGDTPIYFNSGITSASDIQTVLPQINENANDNGRIGDELRAKRLRLRGHIILSDNTDNNMWNKRVGVRLMIVSPKRFPNIDDAYSNFSAWNTALLKRGGTQVGYTGLVRDLYTPINTDEITCYYDKVFYLSQDRVFEWVNTTNVGSKATQGIRDTVKFFNISIPCYNKKLHYDQGASSNLQPTNYGPFLLLGYSFLDGSSADTVSTRIGLVYDSYFTYEDN